MYLKIEKININKVRVTINTDDLINMNLSVNAIAPNSPVLHDFLRSIMERVIEETGFNPYSGQVMVQATPYDDGIILIITKIPAKQKKKPKNVRVTGHRNASKITYRFKYFENVCRLFSAVDSDKFKKASLYEYMDNFYIIISRGKISVMSEFSDSDSALFLSESFLEEHGKLHAKNEKLVDMAKGVKELMKY